MFEYSFVPTGMTRRPLTVVVAALGEAILITGLVLVPMFFVEELPARGFEGVDARAGSYRASGPSTAHVGQGYSPLSAGAAKIQRRCFGEPGRRAESCGDHQRSARR